MLYCENCGKEVIIVGEGSLAGMDEEIEEWEEKIKKKGKLILYDPPTSSAYLCPKCGQELIEKE
ncbi:MAG: hypothetical protein GF311_06825 [Candidatus Lokiarchaeota archaeon]|jgi:predicted RNA-binding Zn-ribbon protein involved in translation (DUF1610 family)|nr:hypothetical protein [Candidatus Lokiarchaeota archaeon]